jgi:chitinase
MVIAAHAIKMPLPTCMFLDSHTRERLPQGSMPVSAGRSRRFRPPATIRDTMIRHRLLLVPILTLAVPACSDGISDAARPATHTGSGGSTSAPPEGGSGGGAGGGAGGAANDGGSAASATGGAQEAGGSQAAGATGSGGGAAGALPDAGSSGGALPDAGSALRDGAPDARDSTTDSEGSTGTTGPAVKVVAYLPNYSGSYAGWATRIDFAKMTHLNLAFATATASNGWDMGASDQEVKTLVDAAHAAGVKVIASLGGGGGDQTVIARFKNPANDDQLVANLDAFLKRLNLDGADIDVEDESNLGANYAAFVQKTIAVLHPEGKIVTAAVAQYLQGGMSDATLHSFDFINVMIYTNNTSDFTNAAKFYTQTKGVPKEMTTLGAGFFGTDSSFNEYAYSDIVRADASAWSKNQAQIQGKTVNYTGVQRMKDITTIAAGFGGIMFWELSEDVAGEHSLWKAIQDTL